MTTPRANEARQSALLAKKTASQATFDAAEQERAAAQANMAQAEASLAKAREQLSYAVLKADMDGVVTATGMEVGQTVAPGQAVVTLAEPSRRDAVIDAPDSVAEALWIGEKFNVCMQLDPTRKVTGVVREIAPQADAATRTRRIKIALDDPPDSFRLGATISARIAAGADSFIRLPDSALLRDGRARQRLHRRSQDLRRRRCARSRSRRTATAAGSCAPASTEGERVVTAGVHRLKEGQVVKIYGADTP